MRCDVFSCLSFVRSFFYRASALVVNVFVGFQAVNIYMGGFVHKAFGGGGALVSYFTGCFSGFGCGVIEICCALWFPLPFFSGVQRFFRLHDCNECLVCSFVLSSQAVWKRYMTAAVLLGLPWSGDIHDVSFYRAVSISDSNSSDVEVTRSTHGVGCTGTGVLISPRRDLSDKVLFFSSPVTLGRNFRSISPGSSFLFFGWEYGPTKMAEVSLSSVGSLAASSCNPGSSGVLHGTQ